MAGTKDGSALSTIFSIFLGLVFAAFAGVGVYTFYPPPSQLSERILELNREEQLMMGTRGTGELSETDRERIEEMQKERAELQDMQDDLREVWGRNTSIFLMIIATLAMIVSLVQADQLPVLSNGILLGGLFTMLYGVGWIVATHTSVTRFIVMTAALVVTLALGYVRFVRRGTTQPATDAVRVGPEGLSDLQRRVDDLEDRMNRAASVLGGND